MNRYNLFTVMIFFGVSAWAQNTTIKNLNSPDFNKSIQNTKGTLLDVRTPNEFANSHIAHAGQLNYYAFDFEQKLLLLPKDQPVYLYCNTGYRSKRAAEILVKNGYTQVYHLEKGIMDWNLYNYPVVVEPNAEPDTDNRMEPDEFYALLNSEKPVFIDFYAPWCAPCRKMMPMMDSLKTEYKSKITIIKINADASKKLVKELQLGSVPYLALYNQGKKVFNHSGIITRKELEKLLKSY